MKKTIELAINFSTQEPKKLLKELCNLKPFSQKLPDTITDGFEEYKATPNWIDEIIHTYQHDVSAYWGTIFKYENLIECNLKKGIVGIQIKNYELEDVKNLIKIITSLPWTIASFANIYTSWDTYRATRFESGHIAHGWACAFKGEGHNRLVSRRWLEFGPWRLLRDETNDISLVQFHDLNADPATALEQAKLGHERMGFSDTGGFIRRDYILELKESQAENTTVVISDDGEKVTRGELWTKLNYKHFPQGLYNSSEHKLEIVFIDRQLSERELLEACMIRYFQDLGEDKPVEQVAYVFIVPEEAQQYLHQLWLRELECWTYPEGLKVRIDTDYYPVPNPPDWVKRLEELGQE